MTPAPRLEQCNSRRDVTLDELLGTTGQDWFSRFVSVECSGDCTDGVVVFRAEGYQTSEDAALALYGQMFGYSACGAPYIPIQRMDLNDCGAMTADSDYQSFVFEGQFYWDPRPVAGEDYHIAVEEKRVNALQLEISREGERLVLTLFRADPDESDFYEDYLDQTLEGTVCEGDEDVVY